MLRINLLPPYIYDKQKKLPFIVGSLALIPLTLGLLFLMYQQASAALDDANKRKTEAQTQSDLYNKNVQDIKKEEDAVAATKAKQTFIASAIKYNEAWPEVYTSMRDVTSPKVLLKTMYVGDDHKTINFTGFCANEEDLVRWWMFLRSQTNMYTDVHFRLPEHPWPPKEENAAGGAGGRQAGMPGMGGSSGMAGSAGATGAAMVGPGMGASPGMGGSSGAGSFGGGGGSSDAVGPEEIEGKKGIKFSAFATLKQPLANGIPTPAWATAGGGGGGAASGGGVGMGGSGGMGMGGSGGGALGPGSRGKAGQ
jgi:hypothetical protein